MCRQLWRAPRALLSVAMLTLSLDGPSLAEIALAEDEVKVNELVKWPLLGIGEVALGSE
jgi:hypothetical protein